MNPEIIETIYVCLCGLLFAFGGTFWKALRRFGIPIITCLYFAHNGVSTTFSLISGGLLCIALHLGYGETKPYWYKFLVGGAWGIPSLLIGFSIWVVLLPVLWIVLFYASNDDTLESQFTWNVCEILVGILIGVVYVQALKGAW